MKKTAPKGGFLWRVSQALLHAAGAGIPAEELSVGFTV